MTRIFRKKSTACTLAVFCFLLIGKVTAEPLQPKVSEPTSYKDFLYGVDEVRKNIETVQCGGWLNTDGSIVGNTVNGSVPVPVIIGVPGRDFDPLGDPATGLGTREDFEYPDYSSTTGYMTACDIHNFDIINPEKLCIKEENTATPENCRRLFERLTEELPQMVADGTFSSGDPSVVCQTTLPGSPPIVQKHYCFMPPNTSPPAGDPPHNCEGQACRTKNPPEFRCQGASVIAKESSFYRHYAATVTTPDAQNWNIEAICYEQYKEFDPKDTVTDVKDERCEIVLPPGEDPEWDDGPSGKQKETVKLPPEETEESDPPDRSAPFPWAKDPKTNVTLVDYDAWKKKQEESGVAPRLSDALAIPVESKAQASKSTPPDSKTDAFDDTAERDFATFWEEEERELLKITRDPEVRMILPARFLHGLSDDDPLFESVKQVTTLPSGLVEVTLRAGREDLGRVLQSFSESRLFHFEEVRIPVLVPVGGDIDARIADWQEWQEHETQAAKSAGRDSLAGKAVPILLKLQAYKLIVDNVRNLRSVLPLYVAELFEADRKVREGIIKWHTDNVEEIVKIQAEHDARENIVRVWRRIQRAMLLTDECQLLWCSNQRYSPPVYSLLDGWWGRTDAEAGSPRDFSYEPESVVSLGLPETKDLLVDFSSFSFPTDPIQVPVLWPVQVRINLPIVPSVGEPPNPVEDYPDFKKIPEDLGIPNFFPIPTVETLNLPIIEIPPDGATVEELEMAADILRDLREKIDGTDYDTQRWEESNDATGIPPPNEDMLEYKKRSDMQNAICRFPHSITLQRPSETESSKEMIVHIENDLRERVARLFARWMANRTEDFAGRTVRRGEDPEAKNSKCAEGILCLILPQQEQKTYSFQWLLPNTRTYAQEFMKSMKDLTLPASDDTNPYLYAPTTLLLRLFPNAELPMRIILPPSE